MGQIFGLFASCMTALLFEAAVILAPSNNTSDILALTGIIFVIWAFVTAMIMFND